jgi:hypothetical protein
LPVNEGKDGMMSKIKLFVIFIAYLFLSGASCQVEMAMSKYNSVKDQVSLGDTKNKVLGILNPTLSPLSSNMMKQPEKYIKDEVLVEIYFFRTGLQSDGLTTDDEFTPYIFNDGKLVGIGWTMIGGAKSQGQSSPRINVQQNTIVY